MLQTVKEGQAGGLFAECQDCVESIGAFIESIEGAANPRIAATIALLEEYGELLYKAHNGEIGKKQLRKHMTRMENNIRNELKSDKIELAFLSYNASMSDSIESVYLAAKADPGCDAFWIPIPYFECGADGSLGAMRYEGADCYPSCQCADWRE